MQDYIQKLFGTTVSPVISYAIVFLLFILVIYLLVRMARALMSGTFVSGGKGRNQRLAVMDATPVDSHRRLVLVRRDDVEHLILIGGPTDLVVEQNIRLAPLRQEPKATMPQEAAQSVRQTPIPLATAAVTTRPAPAVQTPPPMPRPEATKPSWYAAPIPTAPVTTAPTAVVSPAPPAIAPPNMTSPQSSPINAARTVAATTAVPSLDLSLESELDGLLDDLKIDNAQKL